MVKINKTPLLDYKNLLFNKNHCDTVYGRHRPTVTCALDLTIQVTSTIYVGFISRTQLNISETKIENHKINTNTFTCSFGCQAVRLQVYSIGRGKKFKTVLELNTSETQHLIMPS